VEKGELLLKISDNGRGLREADEDGGRGGHGLKSMRKRAVELGGSLEITSQPGFGTQISLRAPLGRRLKELLKTT
jgi:signal transduction histidine kinase